MLGRRADPISPVIKDCLDKGYADLVSFDENIAAPLTIVRHPTVAHSICKLRCRIQTDCLILVINHPAVRFGGKLDYDLSQVADNLQQSFGIKPKLCPNSPIVASACQNSTSYPVALDHLWLNVFDVPDYSVQPRATDAPIVIGRHTRDHRDKWPRNAATIRAAYPTDKDVSIKILGGADVPCKLLGALPSNWTVYNFNEMATADFLKLIDVYVYFHHEEWVEAFSRSVCEAIIFGIPTILPPYFKTLFEDACLYCVPEEVIEVVSELRRSKRRREEIGVRGREKLIARFGPEVHLNRLRNYGVAA